jgi:hypothetical protein
MRLCEPRRECPTSMAKTKKKKRRRINGRSALDGKMLTPSARPLKGDAVSLRARTPAGHSGWRSESGARGQGLVTSALGRLRDNARPALRPACDEIAGLGQAGAGHARLSATSQEARLEPNGGVGSLPQEPRWNAGRRRRSPLGAEPHPHGAEVTLASAGVPPALFFIFCFSFFVTWVERSETRGQQ